MNHEGRDHRGEVVAYARELGLDGLVAIGGDGTMAIAEALHRHGLPTLGVPKTIDNDIAHVERSFGFDTAGKASASWLRNDPDLVQEKLQARCLQFGRESARKVLEDGLQQLATQKGLVCAGMARSTGVEAWAWRPGFVALSLWGGAGVLIYALLWLFVPSD